MREFIIRDWKSQASAETSGDPSADLEEPEEPRRPAIAPAPPAEAEPAEVSGEMPDDAATPPMPELRAAGLAGQVRVARIPAAGKPRTNDRPAPPRPAPETGGERPRKRGERSFIIAYGGAFVGFFEAEDEVTPREAFVRVAQEMSADDGFVPEKLELYKPVLLRSARPTKRIHVVRGKLAKLSWLAKGAGVVPEGATEASASEEPGEGS